MEISRQRKTYEVDCPHPDRDCREIYDTACVVYDSQRELETLGVQKGDDLEYILSQLDRTVKALIDRGDGYSSKITNVGRGASLWNSGLNKSSTLSEMKSLREAPGINIKEGQNEVSIGVNTAWMNTFVGKKSKQVVKEQLVDFKEEIPSMEDLENTNNLIELVDQEVEGIGESLNEIENKIQAQDQETLAINDILIQISSLISSMETRVMAMQQISMTSEGDELILVDGLNKEIARYSLRDIVRVCSPATPVWRDTGQTGCSSSSTQFEASPTGSFGYKEQIDTSEGLQTSGTTRWVKDSSLDSMCNN